MSNLMAATTILSQALGKRTKKEELQHKEKYLAAQMLSVASLQVFSRG